MAALTVDRVQAGEAARLELDAQHLPVAAVEFVKRHHLGGPLYNDYNFGGYLLWQAPELPVFVDGRIEVYQGKVLDDHLRISRAEPGWEALLDQYGVNLVIVRPERAIADALLQDSSWDLLYFDYNAVVFIRDSRNPGVRTLHVISPKGNRDKTDVNGGIAEIRYLLGENPDFFGGHKILAFLLYKRGDLPGAATSLKRYLELHPEGRTVACSRPSALWSARSRSAASAPLPNGSGRTSPAPSCARTARGGTTRGKPPPSRWPRSLRSSSPTSIAARSRAPSRTTSPSDAGVGTSRSPARERKVAGPWEDPWARMGSFFLSVRAGPLCPRARGESRGRSAGMASIPLRVLVIARDDRSHPEAGPTRRSWAGGGLPFGGTVSPRDVSASFPPTS